MHWTLERLADFVESKRLEWRHLRPYERRIVVNNSLREAAIKQAYGEIS